MDLAQNLATPEIQELEQRICSLHGRLFNNLKETKILIAQLEYLMEQRKKRINSFFWKHEETFLPDIVEFNEALTNALQETWNKVANLHLELGYEDIEGTLWFGPEFPKNHPLADCPSIGGKYCYQALWEALTDPDAHHEYKYGIETSVTPMRLVQDSFEEFIGLSKTTPNWNEGLDRELTKDLHLILPFHTLYEHTSFAITDIIYAREFSIEVEVDKEFPYHYDKTKKKFEWPILE